MILSCTSIIWKAEFLRPSEVQTLLTATTGKPGITYNVDVDILNLYHKGRSSANATHKSAMDYVKKKFNALAYEGFRVNAILDGPLRPDCKRSSWQRVSQREFAKVNGHLSRSKALSMSARLGSCDSVKEASELKKHILSLNNESKSLDNIQRRSYDIPDDLADQLEGMIETELYGKSGYNPTNINPTVIQSKFQADSMIACRINTGKSHVAVSEDTDFQVLLKETSFIIRKIETYSKNGVSEQMCEISGRSQVQCNRFKQILTSSRIKWTDCVYPILDTPSPKLRALVAITLGCDVWPTGIYNQGPKRIWEFLQSLPKNYTLKQKEDAMIGFMIQKNSNVKTRHLRRVDKEDLTPPSFDKSVILTLVQAFLDEPAVLADFEAGDWEYAFGMPSTLSKYLEYFARNPKICYENSDDSSSDTSSVSSVDSKKVSKNLNDHFDFENPPSTDFEPLKYLKEGEKKEKKRCFLDDESFMSDFEFSDTLSVGSGITIDANTVLVNKPDERKVSFVPNVDFKNRTTSKPRVKKSSRDSTDDELDSMDNGTACRSDVSKEVSKEKDDSAMDGSNVSKEKDGSSVSKEVPKEKDGSNASKEKDGSNASKEKDGSSVSKVASVQEDGSNVSKEVPKEKDGSNASKEKDGNSVSKVASVQEDGSNVSKEVPKEKDGSNISKEKDDSAMDGSNVSKEKDGSAIDGSSVSKEKDSSSVSKEVSKEKDGSNVSKEVLDVNDDDYWEKVRNMKLPKTITKNMFQFFKNKPFSSDDEEEARASSATKQVSATGDQQQKVDSNDGTKDDESMSSGSSSDSSSDASDVRRTGVSRVKIVQGPPVGYCRGLAGVTQPHLYLEAEGSWDCFSCGVSFCRTCGYVPSLLTPAKKKKSYYLDKKQNLCFGCFKTCTVADGEDVESHDDIKTLKEKLRALNVKVQDDALLHELEDMYEHHSNVRPLYERITHNVIFPVHESSYFDTLKQRVIFTGPVFSSGGFLCSDLYIPDEVVLGILELWASFVDYRPEGESPYSATVPANVEIFANGSRSSGQTAHKVIKSAIRHALDERFLPVHNKEFSLFHYVGRSGQPSIGIILENYVPPSMRNDQYYSRIAVTTEELLACACTCLSGGMNTGDDRVTCIHNLPLFYQVTLLFHSGLAVNFLHDFTSRWNGDLEALASRDTQLYDKYRRCILMLMRASNADQKVIMTAQTTPRITDMLNDYKVGTEKMKMPSYTPPMKHEIIPMRFLPVESVEGRDKRLKKGTNVRTENTKKNAVSGMKDIDDSSSDDSSDDEDMPELESRFVKNPRTGESEEADEDVPELEHRFVQPPRNNGSEPAGGPPQNNVSNLSSVPGTNNMTNDILNDDAYEIDIRAYRLNREEREMIRDAQQTDMPEHVYLSSFMSLVNGMINGHRPQSLWLNDEVINGYIKLLTSMDIAENPTNRSYIFDHHFFFYLHESIRGYDYEGVRTWCEKFPSIDIFNTLRWFVIPINIQNRHWSKVRVFFPEKEIQYVDSMGLNGLPIAKIILRYLEDYAQDHGLPFNKNEWKLKNMGKRSPQQGNSDDCGAFVLINSYLTIKNAPLLYSQRGVDACESRKVIGLSLIKGEALCPITIQRGRVSTTNVREPTSKTVPRGGNQQGGGNQQDGTDNSSSGKKHDSTATNSKSHNKTQPTETWKHDREKEDTVRAAVEQYEMPDYGSFTPDYVKVYGWCKAVFPGNTVPTDFVGYKLLEMRRDKEVENIAAEHGELNANTLVRKKETTAHFDYRSLVKIASKPSVETRNFDFNTNKPVHERKKFKDKDKHGSSKTHRVCSYKGCTNTSRNSLGLSFERIPQAPEHEDMEDLLLKRPRDIGRYYRRDILNKMALDRCGIPQCCTTEQRICSSHKKEIVTVMKVLPREEKKDLRFKFSFCVPVPHNHENETLNRGLGGDRMLIKNIESVPDDPMKSLRLFAMCAMETLDNRKRKNHNAGINQTVQSILDIGDEALAKRLKISGSMERTRASRIKGTVRSFNMRDDEVKNRTGFLTKAHLLAFTAIVCNADIELILQTLHATLTWWEEWFLFYEMCWGRSWVNQKDLAKEYHLNAQRKNDIVDRKLAQVLKCRNSWPKYLLHEEDVALRAGKWEGVVDNTERFILHDSTDVPLHFKPTLASSQKITYNHYYGGCCGKIDIELHICGWVNSNPMYVGGCSDSLYLIKNKIFEQQQKHQESDKVNGNIIPFTNILDKGYKVNLYANRCGRQLVFQPVFRKKGKRFTGNETLRSASCASVRSGNERAVRKAKLSGFLKKGLRPSESPRRLDDMNLAWCFMVNFMYMSTA